MHEKLMAIAKEIHRHTDTHTVDHLDAMLDEHIQEIRKEFLPLQSDVEQLIKEYISHLSEAKNITAKLKSNGAPLGGNYTPEILNHLQNAHNLIFKLELTLRKEMKSSQRLE